MTEAAEDIHWDTITLAEKSLQTAPDLVELNQEKGAQTCFLSQGNKKRHMVAPTAT